MEKTVDACFSKWVHCIDQGWISRPGNIRQYDIARSIRTLTMEISGHVCFSEGFDFTEDQTQLDNFWASIEENAPYGQYLSVIPELFKSIYALTKIPAMKERMILTETNNPGIGKIIEVWMFLENTEIRQSKLRILWLTDCTDRPESYRAAVRPKLQTAR